MSFIDNKSFLTPCEWVLDIIDIASEEVSDYIPQIDASNVEYISLILNTSNDSEKVMSALINLKYLLRKPEYTNEARNLFSAIPVVRIEELMKMSIEIMRLCVESIPLYGSKSPQSLLREVGHLVSKDPLCVESIVETSLKFQWALTPEFISIIDDSHSGWKYLHRFNFENKLKSKKILSLCLSQSRNYKLSVLSLLASNGSALQYLIHVDDSLGLTIASINKFELWHSVLINPAAKPIVEFAMKNFHLVESGKFYTRKSLREWMIPMLSKGPLVSQYVEIGDLHAKLVDQEFFKNPFAIHLITEWITEPDNMSDRVLDGLVHIAASDNRECAVKSMEYLKTLPFEELTVPRMVFLLNGPHSRKDAELILFEEDFDNDIDDILIISELIPYWYYSSDEDHNDKSQLINLTPETVKNLYLNCGENEMRDNVEFLNYDDWRILLRTEFGVELAIDNIGYIIACGLVWDLLRSPHLTRDMILELDLYTDVFEYAGDEEFTSLLSRKDVYEVNIDEVYREKKALCQEVVVFWFEPNRLSRFASSAGMDLRSYLNVM